VLQEKASGRMGGYFDPARRVGRCLERQGWLTQDAENSYRVSLEECRFLKGRQLRLDAGIDLGFGDAARSSRTSKGYRSQAGSSCAWGRKTGAMPAAAGAGFVRPLTGSHASRRSMCPRASCGPSARRPHVSHSKVRASLRISVNVGSLPALPPQRRIE
jgi:hypothetical protein